MHTACKHTARIRTLLFDYLTILTKAGGWESDLTPRGFDTVGRLGQARSHEKTVQHGFIKLRKVLQKATVEVSCLTGCLHAFCSLPGERWRVNLVAGRQPKYGWESFLANSERQSRSVRFKPMVGVSPRGLTRAR